MPSTSTCAQARRKHALDMLLTAWHLRIPQISFDVTVSCSFLPTYLDKAIADGNEIFVRRGQQKVDHYTADCDDLGIAFCAWVLNSMGGMGPSSFWEWFDGMFKRHGALQHAQGAPKGAAAESKSLALAELQAVFIRAQTNQVRSLANPTVSEMERYQQRKDLKIKEKERIAAQGTAPPAPKPAQPPPAPARAPDPPRVFVARYPRRTPPRIPDCPGCPSCADPRMYRASCIDCIRSKNALLANPFTTSNIAHRRPDAMSDTQRRHLCDAHDTYIAALPTRTVKDVLQEYAAKGADIVLGVGYRNEAPQQRHEEIQRMAQRVADGDSLRLTCVCHPERCHCDGLAVEIQRRAGALCCRARAGPPAGQR